MSPDDIVKMFHDRAWIPLATVIIYVLIRVLKDDTVLPTIPSRYRYWAALMLGVASGILEKVTTGVTWKDAIIGGLTSAIFAILFHNGMIDSIRGGKEFAVPRLTLPGVPPSPGKPPSIPPIKLPQNDRETPTGGP